MTIFRYPGGKSKKSIYNKILAYFPDNYKEYREPFVGGGGIFFNVNPNIKRWINDKDDDLMAVYFALKKHSKDFINKCKSIQPINLSKNFSKEVARLERVFNSFKAGHDDPALRYFFLHRTVWAGRVRYDIPSRIYFSNPKGWNIVNTDKLENTADLLKNTIITCGDYNILLKCPGKNVFIYCDAPYYKNTNLAKSSQLYTHNFTQEDHIYLRDNIRQCKHKVCISYDDCKFIRGLYKDFNIFSDKWIYCGTSSAKNQSKKKVKGKELIITNYEN